MCLFMMGWGWTTWACNKVRLSFNNQERKDRASQVKLVVKNPPANAGDVRNLGLIPGRGRSPGGGHSNTLPAFLPGESSWTEEPGELRPIGSQRVRHN